jgi:hypothetical protein
MTASTHPIALICSISGARYSVDHLNSGRQSVCVWAMSIRSSATLAGSVSIGISLRVEMTSAGSPPAPGTFYTLRDPYYTTSGGGAYLGAASLLDTLQAPNPFGCLVSG